MPQSKLPRSQSGLRLPLQQPLLQSMLAEEHLKGMCRRRCP